MTPFIVAQWEQNKDRLREQFAITPQDKYSTYKELLEMVIAHAVPMMREGEPFQLSRLVEIDHGHYQGTQIYLLANDSYQPDMGDYIVLDNSYGSCSGCDTLAYIQSLAGWDHYDDCPTSEQIDRYMTLALHMVQRMRYLESHS